LPKLKSPPQKKTKKKKKEGKGGLAWSESSTAKA
jgi:hypothetical protein